MVDCDLRVIHTISSLASSAGGPTQTVTSLCREMVTLGARVDILAKNFQSGLFDAENQGLVAQIDPVSPHFSRCLPWASRYRFALEKLIAQSRQRVVLHDNGIWLASNHIVARVAKGLGIPRIVSTHGMLEPWALQHRRMKKWIAWAIYQRRDLLAADLVHATAERELEGLRSRGFMAPVAVIPHGVFQPVTPVHRQPVFSNTRTALFLSRLHPVKGLENLVKAWALLKPLGWKLIIAGPDEGGYRLQIERQVRVLGLQSSIQFVGAVEGQVKERLFRDSDLFVLPTFSENFGVVIAEALSYSIPVITTHGAPWEDLETYGCGWWIELGVDPLVRALKEATDLSDEERLKMGENAKQYSRRLDWAGVAEKMIATYEWILMRGDKPDFVYL